MKVISLEFVLRKLGRDFLVLALR